MDAIVSAICEGVTRRGERMSEVLALYMARVIMENDPVRYVPNREMEEKEVSSLIETAIARLCEKDAPSMETIKMQIGMDIAYKKSDARLDAIRTKEKEEKKEKVRSILATRPETANDFDTLNLLYRRIFTYLCFVSSSGHDVMKICQVENQDASAAEREIAAAMESVFPRIGLRTFIHLSTEEKSTQLEELARIVTGIRLYNKSNGKGGHTLAPVEEVAARLAIDADEIIRLEIKQQQDLLAQYQDALQEKPNQRWNQELRNRRQYFAYLSTMAEDVTSSLRRITRERERFLAEMDELKTLVAGKTSVPKERVYPMFDAVATAWFQLNDELRTIETHVTNLDELHLFRESFNITLSASIFPDHDAQFFSKQAETMSKEEEYNEAAASRQEKASSSLLSSSSASLNDTVVSTPPKLLSVETTAEFMQLSLEYQGFCGWTIAKREGLLLPGKPELGVVKYKGSCHVFASMHALKEFQQNPDAIRQAVLDATTKAPELVHFLRLRDQFQGMSVPRALAALGHQDQHHPEIHDEHSKQTQDATTETPTHFVEKHIDKSYDWNEWNLRRRTLRIAQLQHCATTSAQTEDSTFRRDGSSQVYLPRIAATQTNRDSATNPVIRTQYLAGLRGGSSTKGPILKYTRNRKNSQTAPCVIDLTLEPLCT